VVQRGRCRSVQVHRWCEAGGEVVLSACGAAHGPALHSSQARVRPQHTGEYLDEIHTEGDVTGYAVGEYGYKYRMVDGVAMPP